MDGSAAGPRVQRPSGAMSGCGAIGVLFLLFVAIGQCAGSSDNQKTADTDLGEIARKAQMQQAFNAMPTKREPGVRTGPAPGGIPKTVASAAIAEAGHACGAVRDALRVPPDGSIVATCSNGERFRVFTIADQEDKDVTVALKCSAAEKLGVQAC